MASFKYQYVTCTLDYIPNDVSIQILSYLTDASGYVFLSTSTLDIDTFTIQTYKNSLPLSGYDSFLSIIAGKFISEKYSNSIAGYSVNGSTIITQISDTSKIVPGLYAYGTGVPTDTTVLNVRDKNSIELSTAITATGNISLALSTRGWDIDYSQIQHLTNVIDFNSL